MFRTFLTIAAAIVFLPVAVHAQTVDEIIAKNVQAHGGMEKMKAVQTVRITGKLNAGGIRAGFLQENKRPDKVREEQIIQGLAAIQAYDGKIGWQVNPFGGRRDPELMSQDDIKGLTIDADIDGPLVDYKEKGNTVEYLGHDVVDGDDALRLKVTQKDGDIMYYYLDPDTYLEIRKEIQESIRGSVRETVIDLGSYKPVAGVMFPFSISQGAKSNPGEQTTTIEKLEVNIPIDPGEFAVPPSLRSEEKGSGMVGIK